LYKHVLLILLSLLPFGVSTAVALTTWGALQVLAPASRLVVVVVLWIATFAAMTRAFWEAVGVMTPW